MGFVRTVCDECGYEAFAYASCRNRHCPQCQAFAAAKWESSVLADTLPVEYHHAVFTVPNSLDETFLDPRKQAACYNALMKAAWETVRDMTARRGFLPAVTAALHTWTQKLLYHPHVHMLVSGGGLGVDGDWVRCEKGFLFPVKAASRVFRGKLVESLLAAGLIDRSAVAGLYATEWVVYSKGAGDDPKRVTGYLAGEMRGVAVSDSRIEDLEPVATASTERVARYLARYTRGVAILSSSIESLEGGIVTFTWKDRTNGGAVKTAKLDAVEFIRRFMLHVLPSGFHKVRRYGLVASRAKAKKLAWCRALLECDTPDATVLDAHSWLTSVLGSGFDLCPACRKGRMRDPFVEYVRGCG
jgi:hypothetical protein